MGIGSKTGVRISEVRISEAPLYTNTIFLGAPTLQDYWLNFTINSDTGLPCKTATSTYIIGNLTLDPSQDNVIQIQVFQNTKLKFVTAPQNVVINMTDIQINGSSLLFNSSDTGTLLHERRLSVHRQTSQIWDSQMVTEIQFD